MQTSLVGKVAIVTGVSGDGQVGQAVAKALAENGARLAICARKQSNVEARAKELRDAGARVFAMVGSLTDEGQVQRLIDGTVGEYGRIDVLVNLAGGLSRYKTAVEHSLDDWRSEVDNNLREPDFELRHTQRCPLATEIRTAQSRSRTSASCHKQTKHGAPHP